MSKNYTDKNILINIVEQGGKLYCYVRPSASLTYEQGSLVLSDIGTSNGRPASSAEYKVTGTYKTKADEMNAQQEFNFTAIFIYEDNNLVLDSYKE